jgi:hypothetical protein
LLLIIGQTAITKIQIFYCSTTRPMIGVSRMP